jgi:hypothetical protein
MAMWDEERAWQIIDTAFEEIKAGRTGPADKFQCAKDLVDLLGSVRAEAIGWTWTEARSQHDRGMDPRNFEVPKLLEMSNADLNPERNK